jgi:hypothetical protein
VKTMLDARHKNVFKLLKMARNASEEADQELEDLISSDEEYKVIEKCREAQQAAQEALDILEKEWHD